jgi:ABC-2 type transport system permease protein
MYFSRSLASSLENEEGEGMFWHVFVYRLKCLVRDRELVFWTLIFSILLGTLFYVAFGHLTAESARFQPIKVAVVNNEAYNQDPALQAVLKELSSAGANQMLDLLVVDDKEAEELLEEGAVSGIITAGELPRLTVKEPGIYQSILKMILDEYIQTTKTITNIVSRNPQVSGELFENLQSQNGYRRDYTEQISFSDAMPDMVLGYFYALLAMACMYSGFCGLRNAFDIQADLSDKGARRSVAPTHKMVVVLADSAAALAISFSEVLILLGYLAFVLGVNFGNQVGYVLLTCLAGSVAGVSFGTFIGTSVRGSEGVKTGLLIGSTMAMSFLAGLMWIDMKHVVALKAPWLVYINPATLVADAFYSLYIFDTHRRFFINIGMLCVISAVFCGLSFVRLRREKYASI